jgi:hypothetical protein
MTVVLHSAWHVCGTRAAFTTYLNNVVNVLHTTASTTVPARA